MIDKSKFIQAFTTTLIHLPIIFWQAFLMDSVIWKFAFMVITFFTFLTAYISETINKRPMLIYWAVPLFLILFFVLQIAKVEEFGVFVQLMTSFGYLFWYKMSDKKEPKQINNFEDLLVRGNLPDDPRVVPNYLKIKNAQYDDVNFSNNTVDELIKLDSEEFNELVSQTDNGLLFTWLSTLREEDLEKFYTYNEEKVKLANGTKLSSKEQFENAMTSINKEEITDAQRARATLEMPLAINYAKEFYIKTITFRVFRTYDYFKEYEDEKDARFEVTLSNIIWDEMKYIPEYFEQVLTLYHDVYDEKSEYHQKIFKHLAARFGALIATLNRIVSLTQSKQDSLNWFTGEMIKNDLVPPLEISVSQTKKLESDKKLINFLTLMYVGICDENEEHYISNLIECAYVLFEWYPANSDACEYALQEMMKSVALKNVSVESANRFLEFFEDLPRFYKVLSYEKIMNLKELINHTLATYKLLESRVFEQDGVKNRIILLNYKIDMENLYYESWKEK